MCGHRSSCRTGEGVRLILNTHILKLIVLVLMDVAKIFQRGGHTESYIGYSPDCHLNIVGCLFTKKSLQRGGHGHPRTPPPGYALACTRGFVKDVLVTECVDKGRRCSLIFLYSHIVILITYNPRQRPWHA